MMAVGKAGPKKIVDPDKKSSLALKVSAEGFGLDVKGDGAARLSGALADLLSPFTGTFGLIGDRISDARHAAAYRAAQKGVKMLKEEGIEVGNVPPKILLPWLEGASLETDDGVSGDEKATSLEDEWAGLLVRAVKSSDAVVISYIETLKRLGAKEAKLLAFFATDTEPFFSAKFYEPRYMGTFSRSQEAVKPLLEKLNLCQNPGEISDIMETFGIQFMSQILYYSVNGGQFSTTKYYDENEHAVSNLEHLGLIEISSQRFAHESRVYDVRYFYITKYAFDMFWACQGKITGIASLPSKAPSKA
jgi:hypothetical protein